MEQDIFIKHIEALAPLKGACSWDCSGIQIMSNRQSVHRCLVALDVTVDVIEYAVSIGADIIITHHPLSLSPLVLHKESFYSPLLRLLYQHNITLYSAHTSLDATIHSVAGFLADIFSLENREPIEITHSEYLCSFTFFPSVDIQYIERTMHSLCIVCSSYHKTDDCTTFYIDETFAYAMNSFLQKEDIPYISTPTERICRQYGIGCIGLRQTPLSRNELFSLLNKECAINHVRLHGELPNEIRRIAYCTGAGSSLIERLRTYPHHIDVYITGEIKHHDAVYSTIPLLDVGHFTLEEAMMKYFAKKLQNMCEDVTITMYSSIDPFTYIAL